VEYRGPITAAAVKQDVDVNFAKGIGPDYWEKRKGVFEFKMPPGSRLNAGKLATLVGTDPVTLKAPAARVRAKDGTSVLGTIRVKDDPKAEESPAVVTRQHGKGRVVYLAAGFDAGYYLYSYPYQRLVIADSIRWAAGEFKQPVTVQAPMCVHSTVMRQVRDGKVRLVVHLFNDANSTGGHALPNDDVPLREESLPVHDIRVTFRPGYRLREVRQEPGGKVLEMKETADGVTVTVPKLDIHTLVVGELEPANR
jgi:hypothetical protein